MSLMKNYAKFCDYVLIIGGTLSGIMKNELIDMNLPILLSYASKGPLSSGARGIDFSAPGDAVDPKWHSNQLDIFFGTSYASANAAGAIACLISALKANEIKLSPAMLRWALSNTSYLPENGDKLEFGDGILQIKNAFEYLVNTKNFPKYFQKSKKGILLIKKEKEAIIKMYKMCIKNFDDKISWIIKLKSKGMTEFVEHSTNVRKSKFSVKIDTTYLSNGSINYAEIHGIDSSNASLGVLFHIPITVIIPEELTTTNIIYKEFILKNIEPYRIFVYFPEEFCTQCNIMISMMHAETTCELGIQYSNEFSDEKTEISFEFSPKEVNQNSIIKINPSAMYEICIYPFRSCNTLILKEDFIMSKFNCTLSVS